VLGAATLQTAYTPSASIIAAAQSTPSLKSTPMPKRRRDGASAAATPRPKRLKKSSEGAGGGPFSGIDQCPPQLLRLTPRQRI